MALAARPLAPRYDRPAPPARHLRAVPGPGFAEASAPVRRLHAPLDPAPAPPLRLTRRGVAVLALAVAVLGVALVWAAAHSAPQSPATVGHAGRSVPAVVTVRSGDTLWQIAARIAPQVDPRGEVAVLQRLNHLPSASLRPGQRVRTR